MNIIRVLLCFSFIALTLGQEIELNLGGNVGTSQQFWGDVNKKGVYHSFGQGIEVGGKFILPLQENLGIETGLQFLAGTKRKVRKGDKEIEFSSTLLSLPLGMHFRIDLNNNFTLYTRFGALLGLVAKANVIYSDFGPNPDVITEYNYSKGTSAGFYSSLGVQIPFSSDLYFFGELGYQSISWRPQERERTTTIGSISNKTVTTLVKDNPADNEDFSPSLPFSALKLQVGIGKSF